MKVHLRQIPQGGTLHLVGDEDPAFLDLAESGADATGPLRYDLHIGLSDGGLFATGHLRIRMRFTCVATLEPFEREIEIPNFAIQKELGPTEVVDLTQEIREDIHLALPAHPRSAAALQKHSFQAASPEATDGGGNSGAGLWKALDQLKTTN